MAWRAVIVSFQQQFKKKRFPSLSQQRCWRERGIIIVRGHTLDVSEEGIKYFHCTERNSLQTSGISLAAQLGGAQGKSYWKIPCLHLKIVYLEASRYNQGSYTDAFEKPRYSVSVRRVAGASASNGLLEGRQSRKLLQRFGAGGSWAIT